MELAEHLQGKIERRLQFYEAAAKRIDAPYLAEVERLARETENAIRAAAMITRVFIASG
jgi:hypothetical protein